MGSLSHGSMLCPADLICSCCGIMSLGPVCEMRQHVPTQNAVINPDFGRLGDGWNLRADPAVVVASRAKSPTANFTRTFVGIANCPPAAGADVSGNVAAPDCARAANRTTDRFFAPAL
jgi:hypothetical protein